MVEIIVTVVLEAIQCLAGPSQRQFSYLRKYDNNLENLKKEIAEMNGHRQRVQQLVDEAKRRGEEICDIVDKWLKNVSNAIDEAEKSVGVQQATANKKQCFKGLCPNLKARFQLSKQVVKQQEAISKLREEVGSLLLVGISYGPILEDHWLFANKDYETFESRNSTLNAVLSALEEPDVNMLGLYGMGGLGKTTLAREVARQVKGKFDHVIFAEVSPSPDIRKIQKEIADKLSLPLHGDSDLARAMNLYNLLKEKKILVILDNIWKDLNLQDVGIPHGGGGDPSECKVLLTARDLNVLLMMDSRHNFPIGFLNDKEAWGLFKKMAGEYIEGSLFKSVATKVVKRCAGLPVSIATVGKALRKKDLTVWKDAEKKLRRPWGVDFQTVQPEAFSAIDFSYSKLEGGELKKMFLLIAYACIRSTDRLLMFGMGLGLLGGVDNMEEARNRVHALVFKLKESCMLLDHESNYAKLFSMHDVVRDVAISIASREQNNVLTVENGELDNRLSDESRAKSYTSIVLLDVKTNIVLPEELDCSQLKLFHVRSVDRSSSSTIPNFAKMKKVRVLDLTFMHLSPTPSSLGLLTNLRTLRLCNCKLQDVAVIGNFKKLEILCLEGSKIKKLPEEVGELTLLKVLDLRWCKGLEVIPPNVLSKLSCLEELYIYSFEKWGMEEVEGVKNASLDELKHLPNLTSLQLHVKDVDTLPRGLFFEKLEWFKIRIGSEWWDPTDSSRASFALELQNTKIRLKEGLMVPLKGVEALRLYGLQDQDVKYLVDEFVKVGSLQQLERLSIKGRDTPNLKMEEESTSDMQLDEIISDGSSFFLEKVAAPNLVSLALHSINIERIWQHQLAAISSGFQNLTHLNVEDCWNLKCLFSTSILGCCVQLKYLVIRNCPLLEEIVIVDPTKMKKVIFNRLHSLKLENLKKLTSFCTGDVLIEFPSLQELKIEECPEFMEKYKSSNHDFTKEVWVPNLDHLKVEEKDISWIFQSPEDFIRKLKFVDVLFENESTIISSLDFLQRFHTIKFLVISGRTFYQRLYENGFTAVIRKDRKFYDMKSVLKPSANFNNLETLKFAYLDCDNLINLVPSSATFHNLTTLVVDHCEGFKKPLTSSTAKSLVRLREMRIEHSGSIREIVTDDEADNATKDEINFRELKELELHGLKNLISFYSGNCSLKFPSLETLLIQECSNMKIFFGGELSTPKLYKVQLDKWNKEKWIWKGDLNITML